MWLWRPLSSLGILPTTLPQGKELPVTASCRWSLQKYVLSSALQADSDYEKRMILNSQKKFITFQTFHSKALANQKYIKVHCYLGFMDYNMHVVEFPILVHWIFWRWYIYSSYQKDLLFLYDHAKYLYLIIRKGYVLTVSVI